MRCATVHILVAILTLTLHKLLPDSGITLSINKTEFSIPVMLGCISKQNQDPIIEYQSKV
jgi:hypothetical protein